MTRVKRAICLFVVFVMTGSFLIGCALFERDVNYFNNLTVARIGSDIRITKGQLIHAYNTFGFQYVQQGMSVREAYERTLDDLIERTILVELSIRNFSFGDMTDAQRLTHMNTLRSGNGRDSLYYSALFPHEQAEARRNAFDALDRFYIQLQDRVREERNFAFNAPEDAEDPNLVRPTPAQEPFRPFEPLVIRNSTNTVFDMDISAFVDREVFTAPLAWSPDIDSSGDSITHTVKTEALVRLVRVLRNNERGMRVGNAEAGIVNEPNYLTVSERAVIGRELNRMIEENSMTLLLRRFQDVFELGIPAPIDRSQFERATGFELAIRASILGIRNIPGRSEFDSATAHEMAIRELIREVAGGHVADCAGEADGTCEGCREFFSTQRTRAQDLHRQARDFYRSQVLTQYNRFVKGMDTEESLSGRVLESLDGIFWLPTSVAESHFTVSHILIQFNDEQQVEFERIQAEFAAGGSVNVDTFNTDMAALADTLSVRARDEHGVEYGVPVRATEIRNQIVNAIGGHRVNVPQLHGAPRDSINVPSFGNMTPAQRRDEEQRRISIFRDFIYKYNQDPGMNNPDFEYVMSVANSRMVPEFTTASRELFGYMRVARTTGNPARPVFDGEGNPVYDWVRRDGSAPGIDTFTPVRSSMTHDLVMTDFGAHIIMYTRTLCDFIYNTNQKINFASFQQALDMMIDGVVPGATNFLFAPLTSYGNTFGLSGRLVDAPARTMFDVVVERAVRPSFESMRNAMVVNFKSERVGDAQDGRLVNRITIYRRNFRDLF